MTSALDLFQNLIGLKWESDSFNLQDITFNSNETYSFNQRRETHLEGTNTTELLHLSNSSSYGNTFDSLGYDSNDLNVTDWNGYTETGVIVTTGDIEARILTNITFSGQHVIADNTTTHNVEHLTLTTQSLITTSNNAIDHYGPHKGIIAGRNLGAYGNALTTLEASGMYVAFGGDNYVVETTLISSGESTNKVCSIDLRHVESFHSNNLILTAANKAQCIKVDGEYHVLDEIKITTPIFEQLATSSFNTTQLVFKGEAIKLRGQININELHTLDNPHVEICSTAHGWIGNIKLNKGTLLQNGDVIIGNLETNDTSVKLLVHASDEVRNIGSRIGNLTLNTSTLEYKGSIHSDTIAATLHGETILHDQIFANNTANFTAIDSSLTVKGTLYADTATLASDTVIIDDKATITTDKRLTLTANDVKLKSESWIHAGALTITNHNNEYADTVLCEGCRLLVRGIEDSLILTTNFPIHRVHYSRGETVGCGHRDYNRWQCGEMLNHIGNRLFGSKKSERVYCDGSSDCYVETHSHGTGAVISFNGYLSLGATHLSIDLSNVWIEELQLLDHTIAPSISSSHITKKVHITQGVIGGPSSPHTCETIANEYGIEGAACIQYYRVYNYIDTYGRLFQHSEPAGHVVTKAIDEVSARLIVGSVQGNIEQGILLNWQSMNGQNHLEGFGKEVVTSSYFHQASINFYTNPASNTYDIRTTFGPAYYASLGILEDMLSMPEMFAGITSGDNVQPLIISPLMMSRDFIVKCDDKEGKEQLDCEQYVLLKHLGFTGNVPVQFDFGAWDKLINKFIYEDDDFRFLELISAYGSNSSLLRDFAANTLREHKRIDATLGSPLSEQQKNSLFEPIVWPVWDNDCLTKDAQGKVIFSGKRCITYKLYIPDDYISAQMNGAVFAGHYIDLNIRGTSVVGPGGKLLQFDQKTEKNIKYLKEGNGGINISRNNKVLEVDETGRPVSFIETHGDVFNLGGQIGGRLRMNINGNYNQGGGKLTFVDEGDIVANSINIKTLQHGNTILDTSKITLFCTKDKENCVLYLESTEGDIVRDATQSYIEGDLLITSKKNVFERTVHSSTRVQDWTGDMYIFRPTWKSFLNQNYVLGKVVIAAEKKYEGIGVSYMAEEGGSIYGDEATILRALTSYDWIYAYGEKCDDGSCTTKEIEGDSSHTTMVQLEGNSWIIGSDKEGSVTHGEGIQYSGGVKGVNLVLQGGLVELHEHLVAHRMKQTITEEGFLGASGPKLDKANIPGLRSVDKIMDKGDWLGGITGLITDVVSAGKMFDSLKNARWMQTLPMAGGVAALGAMLGDMLQAKVSFGESVTVFSEEGVTSLPNRIGLDRNTEGDAKDGFFEIHSKGDASISNTKANVKEINMIVAGQLTIRSGVNKKKTTVDRTSKTIEGTISLSGVSLTPTYSESEQKTDEETHDASDFWAQDVTIVADGKLNVIGALIGGEKVKVDAKEVLVQNVLDKLHSKSKHASIGVGVMIGWNGNVSPHVTASVGGDMKKTGLVQFVSGLSGEDVEVVADSIAADLDQLTGSKELRTITEDRRDSYGPKAYMKQEGWGISGSISMDPKGNMGGGVNPYWTDGKTQVSATISSDLFTGLSNLGTGLKHWYQDTFGDVSSYDLARANLARHENDLHPDLHAKHDELSESDKEAVAAHRMKQLTKVEDAKRDIEEVKQAHDDGDTSKEKANEKIKEISHKLETDLGERYEVFSEEHPELAEYGQKLAGFILHDMRAPTISNVPPGPAVPVSAAPKPDETRNVIDNKVDDMKQLTPEQKAQVKEQISAFENGDQAMRDAIISKYSNLIRYAATSPSQEASGMKEAHAEPLTFTATTLVALAVLSACYALTYTQPGMEHQREQIGKLVTDLGEHLEGRMNELGDLLNDLFPKVDDAKTKQPPAHKDTSGDTGMPGGLEPDEDPEEHVKKQTKEQEIKFHENEAQIKHVFREGEKGHVSDTPANRKLILETVNDKRNFIKVDDNGVKWYTKTLEDGRQVWARVWKDTIRNAGINNIPKTY